MAKKFKYEYDNLLLIPKQYQSSNKKCFDYFNEIEETISYVTYKNKVIDFWDERIHVRYSRMIVSTIISILLALCALIAIATGFSILGYVFIGTSFLFMVGRVFFQDKFKNAVMQRNFIDGMLSPEAIEKLEQDKLQNNL
jgi:hypothetical protein